MVAGDLCAIGRLSRAETGDTLSSVEDPRVLMPWSLPEPLLPVAIVAQSKADDDKLSQALARLAAEDPSIRVENNAETHQLVMWCMGEAHSDVVLERLAGRFSVHVDQVPFVVSLRETFAGKGCGKGRHVKQSGGHGQYAVCDIEVEPLPEGSGFEFVDKVVGGSVPRQFIPSVEKGIRAQMERGVRNGYPGRRPARDADRRQGARRRLQRHGLPDGRLARAARGGRGDHGDDARALRHRRRDSCPTTTSAA